MIKLFLVFSLCGSICFSQEKAESDNIITALVNGLKSAIGILNPQPAAERCETRKPPVLKKICPVPKNTEGACKNVFVNSDCSLGKTGQVMKKLFKTSYTTKAKDIVKLNTMVKHPPTDILAACPKYFSMSEDHKENFWIWMMGSLAAQENSCKEKSSNPDTAGAFQLESSNTARKNLRPNVCTDDFISDQYGWLSSIKKMEPNVRCAMAMLTTQIASSCATCKNIKNKSTGSCVTGLGENKKKCSACLLCLPPSERREDLKILSRGNLFCDKPNKCYFENLNNYDRKQSGLDNKSLKEVISSYPYCN